MALTTGSTSSSTDEELSVAIEGPSTGPGLANPRRIRI